MSRKHKHGNTHAPRKHGEQSVSENNATENQNPETQNESPILSQGHPTEEHHSSPNKSGKSSKLWKFLEAAALIAGIGYAVITYRMWQDSHRNFVVEERAWLQVQGDLPIESQIKKGMPIQGRVTIKNDGKTPGKQLLSIFNVIIVKSGDNVRFDYSSGFTLQMGILSPGAFIMNIVATDTPQLLTTEQADDLLQGRSYIAIYGSGEYYDIFGEVHWFTNCAWIGYHQSAFYSSRSCVSYNNTGDGNLPKQK